MSTLFNVNWPDVVAVVGSLGVAAIMLLLIAYVQLWRHRIRREVRGSAPSAPTHRAARVARIVRDVQREAPSEDRIVEYLENADFSNEGNPNFGWKDRFLERSF